jgi:hypothetical protein
MEKLDIISDVINDGGPAFAHGNPECGGHPGMSLRDWYASQSPSMPREWWEMYGQDDRNIDPLIIAKATAEWKFAYADAMLVARSTEKEEE